MKHRLKASILFLVIVCLGGCLSEPDGFACPPGSSLRLADDRWLCDSEYPAQPIPETAVARYVDSLRGSDTNPGTSEQPWQSIVHAAATVVADTTVYIRSGVYDDGLINIANSGKPGKPIVFIPDGFSAVTIKTNGIQSIGNSHIVIAHLRFEDIRGVTGNGIRIEGRRSLNDAPAQNILIRGNTIVNTWSSGIAVWGVRNRNDPGNYRNISRVVIESNLLELNTNGGANEIITVANGADNVDVRFNTLRKGDFNADGSPDGTGDEGVDFKEGVVNSRIYANTFYNLSDTAIYIDGGRGRDQLNRAVYRPLTANIDIFNNRIRDGWGSGIVVSTEGQGDVSGVNIYNNVVARTRRDGIIAWQHRDGRDAGGRVDDVWIFNNTVFGAGLQNPPGGRQWGGIRVSHPAASMRVENNIAWGNMGFDINKNLTNQSVPAPNAAVLPHNLCREAACVVRADPNLTEDGTPLSDVAVDRGVRPEWPQKRDALPPLASKDICAVGRFQGAAWDLGAVEVLRRSGVEQQALSFCVVP